MSFDLKKVEASVAGGILLGHAISLGISFDQHKIVSVDKLIGKFPHELSEKEEEKEEGRKKFKCLEQKENPIM